MNYIESVEIEGFWGTKKVFIKLHDDLNFLIGPNGSGKTTIINLISAVLRADIPALYAVQFNKVTVRLKAINSTRKPVIEVEKVEKKMGNFELQYIIKEKSSDKGSRYGVEGLNDERIYRDLLYARRRRHMERHTVEASVSHILSKIIEINWLSIHRTTAEMENRNKRADSYESSVDQKLQDISSRFSYYFSLLTSKAEKESKNFQEHVFLSLLDQKYSSKDFYSEAFSDIEDKDTVVGFLKDLGVASIKAKKSVNAHYNRVTDVKKRFQSNKKFTIKDVISLSDATRVSEMINEWRGLQEKHSAIFQPRIQFEEIINSLFSGKKLDFGERNTPMIHLKSGEHVNINVLSSGEKQLFILLGEALLQEERPVVFISDEPELSLHVSWQGSLFENIRNLNRSCQILSATHSPDIVGAFQDRVIHIEKCISDVN